MPDCIFCKIINHEAPGQIVYEDDDAVIMLDHRPLLKGHCLLMPKLHIETLLDLPDDRIGPLFSYAKRLARAVQAATEADGSFLAINTHISQSVPHLHIHIVPRWHKDGLFSKVLIWRRAPYKTEAEATKVSEKVRNAFLEV